MTANNYFWRTYDHKEIDWIEEREGAVFGYEIKWGVKTAKASASFLQTYPKAKHQAVNRENDQDFIR